MGFVRWFASNMAADLNKEPDLDEIKTHHENEQFDDLAESGVFVYPILTEFSEASGFEETEGLDVPGTLLALIWAEGAWHLIGEDSGCPVLLDDEVVFFLENIILEATGFLTSFCKEHKVKSDLDLTRLEALLGDTEGYKLGKARIPKKGAPSPDDYAVGP
jgi:hypothetical protein